MIPYIRSTGQSSINCNCDLVILDNNSIVLASLTDIQIKNKKIIADLISDNYSNMTLKDHEDIYFEKSLYTYKKGFRFKSERMENNLTHTIIYSNTIGDYCINWNNENASTLITNYLRNKHYLPVTEEIIEIMMKDKYVDQFIKPLDVYTHNPMFSELKAYGINIHWFKELLNKININGFDDTYDWDKINTIEDYLFTFLQPIKDKLEDNITVLFDKNRIDQEMFNGKVKPFDGQVPIIQSGIEVLNRSRFVYLAAEQGIGKTIMAAKINHCHFKQRNKSYCTLIVAPAITLTQWKSELSVAIGDDIDIHIIKRTDEFIRLYNMNRLKFDKPTYIIVGKETFKLDCKKKPGVNIVTREIERKEAYSLWSGYTSTKQVKNKITIACCPDCGIPLQNTLRKKEDIFFNADDFTGNPKKSNYKCSNCQTVLWQSCYDKTKKTSLINFIKVKNIKFDSIIGDEIHESNGIGSIISNATRTLFNHTKKIILLSGTSNNGYSSSMFNLLLGLLPNKLKKNEVLDIEQFIKTYGTLQAITKRNDGEYYRSGRSEVKDSEFKEVEGINPILFTKYLAENYIFATLDDLGTDLPNLYEEYVPIQQSKLMERNENDLINDIKHANSFNCKMFESTICAHYINNPFSWESIEIAGKDTTETVQPTNLSDNDILLEKEEYLIELCKKEVSENRKCWIYTDFTGESGSGQYMQGQNIPERLKRILEKEGLKVFWLRPNVAPIDRKELIEKNKDKYDLFVSHPKLVQVGINLQFVPTYIVYMPSYHINTIQQAVRRGYRANSTLENRIYYLYYENSIENGICERMQLKKAESQAIEAKFNFHVNVKRTASGLGKRLSDSIV